MEAIEESRASSHVGDSRQKAHRVLREKAQTYRQKAEMLESLADDIERASISGKSDEALWLLALGHMNA